MAREANDVEQMVALSLKDGLFYYWNSYLNDCARDRRQLEPTCVIGTCFEYFAGGWWPRADQPRAWPSPRQDERGAARDASRHGSRDRRMTRRLGTTREDAATPRRAARA